MPLETDHALEQALQRMEQDGKNAVSATVTHDGIEAEISHEAETWTVAGFVQRLWKGPWRAGGRVTKTW